MNQDTLVNIKIAGKWRFIHLLEDHFNLKHDVQLLWADVRSHGGQERFLQEEWEDTKRCLGKKSLNCCCSQQSMYIYIYINLKFIYIYTCKIEKTSLHRFCLESQGPVSQSRTSEAHRNWRVFLRDWRNRNNCEIKTWISYVGDIAIYQVYSPLCFPLLVLISRWISWISHSYLITRWLIPPLF